MREIENFLTFQNVLVKIYWYTLLQMLQSDWLSYSLYLFVNTYRVATSNYVTRPRFSHPNYYRVVAMAHDHGAFGSFSTGSPFQVSA